MVFLSVFTLSGAERKPMSLVIMVDGMRVDAPDNLNMINKEMHRRLFTGGDKILYAFDKITHIIFLQNQLF